MTPLERTQRIRELRSEAPRDRFLRFSIAALAVGPLSAFAAQWLLLAASEPAAFERRLANLQRFAGEIRPFPLQGKPWDWQVAWTWASDLWSLSGGLAAATTLAISVVAILLASALGGLLALPAARNVATADAFATDLRRAGVLERTGWVALRTTVRVFMAFARAVPEYVWAFLLLAVLGPSLWSVILALGVHNAGIIGRLTAESVEHVDPRAASNLRASGAGRGAIALFALLPPIAPRFLLYFFYRWETCVREATVLGMLGVATLGFFIDDARTRGQYDSLLFFVAVGIGIVWLGDLLSAAVRLALRRSA